MLLVSVALAVVCFFLFGSLLCLIRENDRLRAALSSAKWESDKLRESLRGLSYPRVLNVQSTALHPSYFVDDPVGTLEDDSVRPEDHPLYKLHKLTGAA